MKQELKDKYTTTYGCRFYSWQKKKFHAALVDEFKALGMEGSVLMKRRFSVFPRYDYVYGNLKQAKNILVIPYDTPERCLWYKNTYYVNNGTKNQNAGLVQTFVPIIVFYLLFVILLYVLPPFFPTAGAQAAISIVSLFLMALILTALTKGFPNKKNYNRNTSGILTALEIADAIGVDGRRKTAFVFTDANKGVFFGDMILKDELSFMNRNPNVIQLNCVGDGDEICVGYTQGNRKSANELAKCLKGEFKHEMIELKEEERQNSSMAHYKKGLLVTSGTKNEKGYLVTTKTASGKDHELNESLIDTVTDMMKRFIATDKK